MLQLAWAISQPPDKSSGGFDGGFFFFFAQVAFPSACMSCLKNGCVMGGMRTSVGEGDMHMGDAGSGDSS